MNQQQKENLERGFSEIWRREKILMASGCFGALFVLVTGIPVGIIWGGYANLVILSIPIVIFIKIWFWVEKTPCPKCGYSYGGLRPQKRCIHCKIEIKPPPPKDYRISFKEIKYEPIEKISP